MAASLEGNVDFDGDPPVRTRDSVDESLQLFVTLDQPTKTWLNSLHHIWGLCECAPLLLGISSAALLLYHYVIEIVMNFREEERRGDTNFA